MISSYKNTDVTVLLKDLTDVMKEKSTEERELAIQNGTHYSEMLPEEKEPTEEYNNVYEKALFNNKVRVAKDIARLSEIMRLNLKDKNPVLVSLARAGIPVGVLIKRYFKMFYNIELNHYTISIIRGKGIDENALNYIYDKECGADRVCFIDGWTGKGAILNQLKNAINQLKLKDSKWKSLNDNLYVVADPANITEYCGTHDDYLLPSACLNSTVSGLLSRTILNSYIGKKDFHGACYFKKFESIDKTNNFIETIEKEFKQLNKIDKQEFGEKGIEVVKRLSSKYNIADITKIKPGIGETTRVLLRRVPWKIIISDKILLNDLDIQPILRLCKEKNIDIIREDIGSYKAVGIIKDLSSDA